MVILIIIRSLWMLPKLSGFEALSEEVIINLPQYGTSLFLIPCCIFIGVCVGGVVVSYLIFCPSPINLCRYGFSYSFFNVYKSYMLRNTSLML